MKKVTPVYVLIPSPISQGAQKEVTKKMVSSKVASVR